MITVTYTNFSYDGETYTIDDDGSYIDAYQEGEVGVSELFDSVGEVMPEDFDYDKFTPPFPTFEEFDEE